MRHFKTFWSDTKNNCPGYHLDDRVSVRLSVTRSLWPLLILKVPRSPQCWPQELATTQYLVPSSSPQPSSLTPGWRPLTSHLQCTLGGFIQNIFRVSKYFYSLTLTPTIGKIISFPKGRHKKVKHYKSMFSKYQIWICITSWPSVHSLRCQLSYTIKTQPRAQLP